MTEPLDEDLKVRLQRKSNEVFESLKSIEVVDQASLLIFCEKESVSTELIQRISKSKFDELTPLVLGGIFVAGTPTPEIALESFESLVIKAIEKRNAHSFHQSQISSDARMKRHEDDVTSDEYEKVVAENSKLLQSLRDSSATILELQNELEEARESLSKAKFESKLLLKSQEHQMLSLKADLERVCEQFESKENEYRRIEDENLKLTERAKNQNIQLDQLHKQFEASRLQLYNELNEFRTKVANQEEINTKLANENKLLKAANEEKMRQIENFISNKMETPAQKSLQIDRQDRKFDISEGEILHEDTEDSIQDLRQVVVELKLKIEFQEKSIKSLQKENAELNFSVAQKQLEIGRLIDENGKLQTEHNNKSQQAQLIQLETILQSRDESIANLQKNIIKLKENAKHWNERANELINQIDLKEIEANNRIMKLENALQAAENNNRRTEQEFNTQKNLVDKLNDELACLRQQLEASKEKKDTNQEAHLLSRANQITPNLSQNINIQCCSLKEDGELKLLDLRRVPSSKNTRTPKSGVIEPEIQDKNTSSQFSRSYSMAGECQNNSQMSSGNQISVHFKDESFTYSPIKKFKEDCSTFFSAAQTPRTLKNVLEEPLKHRILPQRPLAHVTLSRNKTKLLFKMSWFSIFACSKLRARLLELESSKQLLTKILGSVRTQCDKSWNVQDRVNFVINMLNTHNRQHFIGNDSIKTQSLSAGSRNSHSPSVHLNTLDELQKYINTDINSFPLLEGSTEQLAGLISKNFDQSKTAEMIIELLMRCNRIKEVQEDSLNELVSSMRGSSMAIKRIIDTIPDKRDGNFSINVRGHSDDLRDSLVLVRNNLKCFEQTLTQVFVSYYDLFKESKRLIRDAVFRATDSPLFPHRSITSQRTSGSKYLPSKSVFAIERGSLTKESEANIACVLKPSPLLKQLENEDSNVGCLDKFSDYVRENLLERVEHAEDIPRDKQIYTARPHEMEKIKRQYLSGNEPLLERESASTKVKDFHSEEISLHEPSHALDNLKMSKIAISRQHERNLTVMVPKTKTNFNSIRKLSDHEPAKESSEHETNTKNNDFIALPWKSSGSECIFLLSHPNHLYRHSLRSNK